MEPTYLTALGFLDYVGIGMFALSGALLAAQKRQDFVTFVFFAVVTGVGGGKLEETLAILEGKTPPKKSVNSEQ